MIVVRLAETADIPALLAIEHSAAEAFRATEYAWVADDTVTEVVAYPDLVAARTVWVAEAAGVPVGFVASRRHDTELHVLELDVHYDYQRKGIGRALMARAIEAACNTGCVAVTLTTFRDVAWNAPFYRRLGFEILETPPRIVRIYSRSKPSTASPAGVPCGWSSGGAELSWPLVLDEGDVGRCNPIRANRGARSRGPDVAPRDGISCGIRAAGI